MAAPTTERNGHTRSSPRAPVANDVTPLTARVAGRNRARIVLGAALLVAAAFAAAVLSSNAGHRTAVLSVAKRVPAGETVTARDLEQVMVAAPSSATINASALDSIVGRVAAVDLVPGSLLTRSQLSDRAPASAHAATLGVLVAEGRYPSGLAIGDRVLIVEVPDHNAPGEKSATGPPVPATLTAVADGTNEGSLDVTLAVAPDDAERVAVLAAQDRVALVVSPA